MAILTILRTKDVRKAIFEPHQSEVSIPGIRLFLLDREHWKQNVETRVCHYIHILSMRESSPSLSLFLRNHWCMASKTSIFFLVLCGIFMLIFLVVLFFLLYLCSRKACIVKAIEIVHTEERQENNRPHDHLEMPEQETTPSSHAIQNDYYTPSSTVYSAIDQGKVEETIL